MPASKSRFSSAHLFYFLTLTAAATALFGLFGLPISGFVMLVWIQVLAGANREEALLTAQAEREGRSSEEASPAAPVPTGRSGISKVELLVVLLIAAMLVGLMVPAASDSDPRRQAETSMKLVAKALEAYQQHYGRLPPAVVVDSTGTPLHSWRALILPYLGEEKLAAAYHWDEPWNGPHNSALAQYRPWHYRTYYPQSAGPRTTTSLHYLQVAEQPWVVEHERACSNWLEPTQLNDWQQLQSLPANSQGFWQRGFFTSTYQGRLIVSSGQTLHVHPRVPGDEPADPTTAAHQLVDQLVGLASAPRDFTSELGQPYRQVHYINALRLGFFLVVAIYPLRWLTRK